MRSSLQLFVQLGGLAVCLFLPLWFNPFSAMSFEPAKVALLQSITISLIVAAVGSFFFDRSSTRTTRLRRWIGSMNNPLALPVSSFALVSILATLTSVNWSLGLWGPRDNPHGLITLLCSIAFFLFMAYALQSGEYLDRFITVLLLGSVPVAVYGTAQYLGLDPLDWIANPISPSFSSMGNPNFLGAYLALVIPFTLLRIIIASSQNLRLRYGLVMLSQLACLWLTLARGAWLGLMGGCLAFLAVLVWRWRSRSLLVATVIGLLVGVGVLVKMSTSVLHPWAVQPVASSQEEHLPPAKIDTASVQERLIIWSDTAGLLADRWWLGYGPATFVQVFAERYPSALASIGEPDIGVSDPHNLILSQFVDSGVIGLAAFLWILLAFFQMGPGILARPIGRKTEATLMAIAGSVIAFLIQAQFNPMVIVLSTLFWLDLAFGVAVYRSVRAVP